MYKVQIVGENPDIVISFDYQNIYSHGRKHHQYDTPKIILSCKNGIFHPDTTDICIGFKKDVYKDYTHKYFNFVHAMEYDGYHDLVYHNKRHAVYTPNPDKFCAFLYSNNTPKVRKMFCKQIMQYKPVDCLGSVMRNTPAITPKKTTDMNMYDWSIEPYIYTTNINLPSLLKICLPQIR